MQGYLTAAITCTIVAALDLGFAVWFVAERFFDQDRATSWTLASIAMAILLAIIGLVAGLVGRPESPERTGFLKAAIVWLTLVMGGISVAFFCYVDPVWVSRVMMSLAIVCLATLSLSQTAWPGRRRVLKRAIIVLLALAALVTTWLLPPKPEPVHLVVHTWRGDDGTELLKYASLIAEYQRVHPYTTIEIRQDIGQEEHHTAIMRDLGDGDGLADVVAVELRTMGELYFQPSDWVDLNTQLPGLADAYAPYRYEGGLSPDGRRLLGLPVDMPGAAMCYRRDLFQQAGLPIEREAVAARWRTWQDFLQMGREYHQRTGKGFIDTVQKVFEAIAVQRGGTLFVDRTNHFVRSSESLNTAWRQSLDMLDANISARVPLWTQNWLAGMGDGSFAVMVCPSWLLGLIEERGGTSLRGQWDIAAMPGGGGNWGGTWLAVPKQSRYQRQAAELAAFLTGERGGLATATATNQELSRGLMMPANLRAIAHPQIQSLTHGYFHDAPVGKIFAAQVVTTKPVYLGPRYALMLEILTNALMQIQQTGNTDAAVETWERAIREAAIVCGC